MSEYKLDRTPLKCTIQVAVNNFNYWKSQPLEERLRSANYLNSVAYNYPENDTPKVDRTYFKMGSINNEIL